MSFKAMTRNNPRKSPRRLNEKLGDSRENQESWQICKNGFAVFIRLALKQRHIDKETFVQFSPDMKLSHELGGGEYSLIRA